MVSLSILDLVYNNNAKSYLFIYILNNVIIIGYNLLYSCTQLTNLRGYLSINDIKLQWLLYFAFHFQPWELSLFQSFLSQEKLIQTLSLKCFTKNLISKYKLLNTFRIMTIILVVIDVIAMVAYAPLLYFLIKKLRVEYKTLYMEIKWKLLLTFITTILFLAVRLLLYIDIKFSHWALK